MQIADLDRSGVKYAGIRPGSFMGTVASGRLRE